MKKSTVVTAQCSGDLNKQIQYLEEDGWEVVVESLCIAASGNRYAVIMTKGGAEQTQDV